MTAGREASIFRHRERLQAEGVPADDLTDEEVWSDYERYVGGLIHAALRRRWLRIVNTPEGGLRFEGTILDPKRAAPAPECSQ